MREILFRGRRLHKDKNAWVYGDLLQNSKRKRIQARMERYTGLFDVDENTLGQFTGLLDKNGTKIFEGDICAEWADEQYLVYGQVYLKDGEYYFADKDGYKTDIAFEDCAKLSEWGYLEVIGNVHDNPQLLGGVK